MTKAQPPATSGNTSQASLLVDQAERGEVSWTKAAKLADSCGIKAEFITEKNLRRRLTPEQKQAQEAAIANAMLELQERAAELAKSDPRINAQDPSGNRYLDIFGEEWLDKTPRERQAVIEEDEQRASDERQKQDEEAEERQREEALASHKLQQMRHVEDVAARLGWAVTKRNYGYCGFGSGYIDLYHDASDTAATIRVSDHAAPRGRGGFKSNASPSDLDPYHSPADLDYRIASLSDAIDEAELTSDLAALIGSALQR